MEELKNNNVFHLEIEVYNSRYGDLIERDNFFNGVYSTLEKAVSEGKNWLDKRLQDIYQNSDYCTKEKDTLTLQDMLDDEIISYCFKVTELDPVYAESFEVPDMEYKCKDLAPTHIIYYYNLQGDLERRYFEYLSPKGGYGYIIQRYQTDDENAQNKFKVGNFVTVIDENKKIDQVFVVATVPIRNDPYKLFENVYTLATITDRDRFEFYHDYHERKIRKYEGTIQEDSPLMLLKKIYTKEIEVSQNIWEKIQENKILLHIHPSFKEIKELNRGGKCE